jgi:hypothetical protein
LTLRWQLTKGWVVKKWGQKNRQENDATAEVRTDFEDEVEQEKQEMKNAGGRR